MKPDITPNNNEIQLSDNSFIVSKTDLTGRITYVNREFMKIAGYPESKLLGIQHNVIRHPDMPRGVFKFLWDTLKEGEEFVGFVKNLSSDGSYYWVFANITLDKDKEGNVVGFYSVRRKLQQSVIDVISPLYQEMLTIEKSSSTNVAASKSLDYLVSQVGINGYNDFVLNLYRTGGVS